MVIDFHTHIFPDKIAGKTIKILEENILKQQGENHPAVLDGTLSGLEGAMLGKGIDYSVVLPIATTVTQSKTINNFAAEINGRGGIFSFGSVHPFQDNWEEELERIAQLGLSGIKLHPEYQKVYVDSPESVRVIKKAEKLGLYVILHAGYDIGVAPPVHCMPENLARVVSIMDTDHIIAAHMGGYRAWEDVLKYLAGLPLYFDTSFCLSEIIPGTLAAIIEKHGTEHIIFGSDSPWEDQSETIRMIDNMGFSKAEYEQIMYKNAKKILKMN